jgi:hypothetical protein
MHTGLNERDNMSLYYQVAGYLIARDSATVCLVRPFPGHLTRFPFDGYADTPLDLYLWDGSHLFRQFMRFMVETQWLLSTLARRSSYLCASGANLLAEGSTPESSRLVDSKLADAMGSAWSRLQSASEAAEETRAVRQRRGEWQATLPNTTHFLNCIATLRNELNLPADYPGLDDSWDQGPPEPPLHALGYSLGGYTAQSVFMSWPFLVSSCVTLLAGGALRDMAPTAFADPEEWQTVLHSLRYELDDRFLALRGTDGTETTDTPHWAETVKANAEARTAHEQRIAGIDTELFMAFKRTFYEVFQQERRGSVQTRFAAFRPRMLFVVGGNDPVFQPSQVVDAAPPGGLNLLEIGALSHFLGGRPTGNEEQRQREFWVPEMTALIHRFANAAAERQALERPLTWFDRAMERPAMDRGEWQELYGTLFGSSPEPRTDIVSTLSTGELIDIPTSGALHARQFEQCLDDLLARLNWQPGDGREAPPEGIVFILRNEIPGLLQPPAIVREQAAAMYHDDIGMVRYCHGIALRREVMFAQSHKLCLVLPWDVRRIARDIDEHPGYPSQSECAGGHVLQRASFSTTWADVRKTLFELASGRGKDTVRLFDGNVPLTDRDLSDTARSLIKKAEKYTDHKAFRYVSSVPDCWVWLSRDFLRVGSGQMPDLPRILQELPGAIVQNAQSDDTVREFVRKGDVRVISISRARFNPRFRGRLVLSTTRCRQLLYHLGMCVTLSNPITHEDAAKHLRDTCETAAADEAKH